MWRWCVLIGMVMTMLFGQPGMAKDFLAGASLYADVERYAAFGSHRFGSPGDRATADWIAGELQAAGFSVEFQPVVLGRQYFVERATAQADGATVDATPFWWPPEDKSSFHLTAPVAREGEVAGKILWIELPYDRGAYLGPAHRAAIAQAASRGPAAILLTIDNPGDDRFAYNAGGQALAGAGDGRRRTGPRPVRARGGFGSTADLGRRRPLRAKCCRTQRRCPARHRQRADYRGVDPYDGLVLLRLRAGAGDCQFSGAGPHGRGGEAFRRFCLCRHRWPRNRSWRHGVVS
jgi:hypothetical protein